MSHQEYSRQEWILFSLTDFCLFSNIIKSALSIAKDYYNLHGNLKQVKIYKQVIFIDIYYD